jgi:hypothetical protein
MVSSTDGEEKPVSFVDVKKLFATQLRRRD